MISPDKLWTSGTPAAPKKKTRPSGAQSRELASMKTTVSDPVVFREYPYFNAGSQHVKVTSCQTT